MVLDDELKIFAGRATPLLTENICRNVGVPGAMGIPVGKARTEEFPDGELIVKLTKTSAVAMSLPSSPPPSPSTKTSWNFSSGVTA